MCFFKLVLRGLNSEVLSDDRKDTEGKTTSSMKRLLMRCTAYTVSYVSYTTLKSTYYYFSSRKMRTRYLRE